MHDSSHVQMVNDLDMLFVDQGPLLLTWINLNAIMDR